MKWVKRLLLVIVASLLTASLWGVRELTGSLPALEGEQELAGLSAPVRVERDTLGTPTISARSDDDLYRALGFVHAQERFFQMDLLRRAAAGELSALVGKGALPLDRRNRVHRMRARARERLDPPGPRSELLAAYSEGVNEGLGALDAFPFEYSILGREPEPWRQEDTALVVAAMYFQLNDASARYESALGLLSDTLPEALAEFLSPLGTDWDAPVEGAPIETPPVPSSRPTGAATPSSASFRSPPPMPVFDENIGSNNWAVAGSRSGHGGALLANDMHLGHSVPNIWYRARLIVGDRTQNGVTLPGTPFLVAGSNGDVAWGFTNSNGDWVDLVEIEPDPDDPDRYLTPTGPRSFEAFEEVIEVAGDEPETLTVRETIWGPVIDQDHRGVTRAVRWIAHDRDGINLELGRLANTETIEQAIAIAQRSGMPPQNFVAADRSGAIGWTIAGKIPNRFGFDGRRPSSWADGERGWDGWLPLEDYPVVIRPDSGLIWTANARVVGGEKLARIGDGGYAFAARARQIRDGLLAVDSATEKDMLDVQLDDRAVFMSTWRDYFLEWVEDAELRRAMESDWSGRASADSSGYRVVRELRLAILREVFETLTSPARAADPRFDIGHLRQWDGPLWRLVSEAPEHLVPEPYPSWDAWMASIVERTKASWDGPVADRTWGRARMSQVNHPLSSALPWLSRWLDMRSVPLDGDSNMPRAQSSTNGASQRLVVSPGREDHGLFHMPGGQSGHPLSPFYGAGHDDWLAGRATPLVPGETAYVLELTPP